MERVRLHVFTDSPSNTPVWNFISIINSHGSTFAIHNITLDASRLAFDIACLNLTLVTLRRF